MSMKQPEALKREYRDTMPTEVLHLWAKDALTYIAELEVILESYKRASSTKATTVGMAQLLETFMALTNYLGIDCTEARTMSGKPSDIFIAAIERKIAAQTQTVPKWVDDPPDIEQGQMMNPEWAKAQMQATAKVVLPTWMEPAAFIFQHEETGRVQLVDVQQVEWGFEKNNPRLKNVGAIFTADQVKVMLADGIAPGWRAVPVEPTKEMKAAAVKSVNGPAVYTAVASAALEIEEGIYGEAYEAMLCAAPIMLGRQPLTDEQIFILLEKHGSGKYEATVWVDETETKSGYYKKEERWADTPVAFARAIEAAHGIKRSQNRDNGENNC